MPLSNSDESSPNRSQTFRIEKWKHEAVLTAGVVELVPYLIDLVQWIARIDLLQLIDLLQF